MLERITEEEKEAILNYIDKWGSVKDGRRTADFDYLFRTWNNNKSKYLKDMFTDGLILSKNITFEEGEDELVQKVNKTLLKFGSTFNNNYKNWIDSLRECYVDPEDKHWYSRHSELYYQLCNQITAEALVDNVYNGETFEITLPSGKIYKIQKGSRPVRTLGKIAKEFGIEGYDEFRNQHSIILTQKKLKGNLCLSIHPLDYMTMSDNATNWSSCMSWMDTGCYRQGTVEMMNSPMVIVAYLTASEPFDIGDYESFDWNNKKWRELFVVNKDIITNVKPYPYRNVELTEICLSWIKELAEKAGIGHYTENVYQYSTRSTAVNYIDELDANIIVRPSTDKMYNDFSKLQFAYFSKELSSNVIGFNYSGPSECLACGAEYPELCNEGFIFGLCCGDSEGYQCSHCDEYFDEDDLYYVDGDYLCSDCVEDNATWDPVDEEYHYNENMSEFFITFDGGDTYYTTNLYLCMTARSSMDYLSQNYFTEIKKVRLNYRTVYLIDSNYITNRGWNIIRDQSGYSSEAEFYRWEDCYSADRFKDN